MSILKTKVKDIVGGLFEREKAPEEINREIQEHFKKSREYRIMLQQYQQKLKEREIALNEKEEALIQREIALNEKEEAITKKVKETVLKSVVEEKKQANKELKHIREEIKLLEERKTGLHEAEIRIIDWAGRLERKESDIYEEMIIDANKFQQFKLSIDGFEFEKYVANLLMNNGFKEVKVTKKSGDYGADVIARKDGLKYVFQCKYYTHPVGLDAVQQIFSAKEHYNAHVAIVVTNYIFSKPAKILAENLKVILWDCEDVSRLSEHKLGKV